MLVKPSHAARISGVTKLRISLRRFLHGQRILSVLVNRRWNGTPDRRASGTPVFVNRESRRFEDDQARFLKRQLSLPVSTMSQ